MWITAPQFPTCPQPRRRRSLLFEAPIAPAGLPLFRNLQYHGRNKSRTRRGVGKKRRHARAALDFARETLRYVAGAQPPPVRHGKLGDGQPLRNRRFGPGGQVRCRRCVLADEQVQIALGLDCIRRVENGAQVSSDLPSQRASRDVAGRIVLQMKLLALHGTDGKIAVRAAFSPSWASLMKSWVPCRPRSFSVHHPGGICSGNTTFLVCSPHTIEVALSLFMENSLFNGDLSRGKCRRHPDDVRQLWAVLEGKRRFPLSELVNCRRVLRDLL
jgi:hypothetical protein